jgi:UDP:flavonoid glycosyltransferase YjiC (YdhE family)
LRIVIPITGSRGDVQPVVALSRGLRAAGHHVRVATHADFEPFVRGHGLDFFPIADSSRALHQSPDGDKLITSNGNPFIFLRQYVRLRGPILSQLLANCQRAAADAEVVAITPNALLIAYSVAEAMHLPVFVASFLPSAPTRFLANFLFPEAPPWLPAAGWYNLLSHLAGGEYAWQLIRPAFNRARREALGLRPLPVLGPPLRFWRDTPAVYGFSPLIVPRPPDWGPHHHVTGYWFLDEGSDWQPPAALEDFLAAGPPPVCVGFGSMHNRDAQGAADLVARALRRAGRRGILLTGWGGLAGSPRADDLLVLDSAPHD